MSDIFSELRLREMQLQDVPSLIEIEQQVNESPWSYEHFANSLKAAHLGLVCERETTVVAFALVSTVLDEAELLTIAVHPNHQQRGIARYVLDALVSQAKKNLIKRCLLEVRVSNNRAIALYEACGFQKISVRKAYYPAKQGREDALIYELKL